GSSGSSGESLCPQHHEALSLFCYEDQEAVCLICAISHTHRAHTVVPLSGPSSG
uniref:Tripartite motif protein 39 n=1 Tax=Homo sapiens TaxID=9606 RepID=UPI0000E4459D|nr:Chain A, Tripartite motif protein 39 [Homo sapiens]2DIF_A Chain A, Tripartite motif protein 39 [Homo sapiens]